MNTITRPTSIATGPSLREDSGEERALWLQEPGSRAHSNIDERHAEKAEKSLRNLGQGGLERYALLSLLLARLEGVDFASTAALLDVKPARLEKMIHGEDTIPRSFESRWGLVAEAMRNLQLVLSAEATPRWLVTPIPSLGGRTPFEMIKRNQAARVVALTASYRDQSFS